MIQLLIADASAVERSVLKDIIKNTQKIKFCGEVASPDELKNAVQNLRPDMLIIADSFFGKDKSSQIAEFCETYSLSALVYYEKDEIPKNYIKNLCYIEKPEFIKFSSVKIKEYADFLEQKVFDIKKSIRFENHSGGNGFSSLNSATYVNEAAPLPQLSETFRGRKFKAVLVGVSTGGPTTLLEFIRDIGKDFPLPILITQHIDSFFDKNLINWLNTETCVPIHLAENDVKPLAGHVYFAPSDMHLVLGKTLDDDFHMFLNHDEPVNFLRPAVDKMFRSAAQVLGRDCIGIVLTGMGSDGAKGVKLIKDAGGYTIAQDESSCVIYGMPKAAFEGGGTCEVLPLNQMASRLWELTGRIHCTEQAS